MAMAMVADNGNDNGSCKISGAQVCLIRRLDGKTGGYCFIGNARTPAIYWQQRWLAAYLFRCFCCPAFTLFCRVHWTFLLGSFFRTLFWPVCVCVCAPFKGSPDFVTLSLPLLTVLAWPKNIFAVWHWLPVNFPTNLNFSEGWIL